MSNYQIIIEFETEGKIPTAQLNGEYWEKVIEKIYKALKDSTENYFLIKNGTMKICPKYETLTID